MGKREEIMEITRNAQVLEKRLCLLNQEVHRKRMDCVDSGNFKDTIRITKEHQKVALKISQCLAELNFVVSKMLSEYNED